MMTLLRIDALTMQFGGLLANDRISFEVREGEIIGIIGPNGAGKTTLFASIAGFLRPTSGRVYLAGADITGVRPDLICRRGLARTFQIVRALPELSVLQNVMIGAFLRTSKVHEARAMAEELLDLTGLSAKAHFAGSSLTIADKKRLELARAMATQPRLLLLDEVMAGLNPRERQQAVELVRAIHRRGVTILLIEHVMDVLMPLSQRIIVLNYGRKIAEDTPEVIVRNPEVIAAYLGDSKYARA
ncbi:MAG: ABC transporter ATP-binding protein [Chloroflexales bacterium]|nr:ABC transporter ATP-binding protein [Chloroflexales bacterium]